MEARRVSEGVPSLVPRLRVGLPLGVNGTTEHLYPKRAEGRLASRRIGDAHRSLARIEL